MQLNQKGASLLSVLISSAITMLSFFTYMKYQETLRMQELQVEETFIAEAQMSELQEFFAALKKEGIVAYLSKNPSTGLSQIEHRPYLCSHMNLLDRSLDRLLNEDPVAALPTSRLDKGDRLNSANRYYVVQVVDQNTLQVNSTACNQRFGTTPGTYQLKPNETLLITVSVSWVKRGKLRRSPWINELNWYGSLDGKSETVSKQGCSSSGACAKKYYGNGEVGKVSSVMVIPE